MIGICCCLICDTRLTTWLEHGLPARRRDHDLLAGWAALLLRLEECTVKAHGLTGLTGLRQATLSEGLAPTSTSSSTRIRIRGATRRGRGFTLILRNLHWSQARLAMLAAFCLRVRIAPGVPPDGDPVVESIRIPPSLHQASRGRDGARAKANGSRLRISRPTSVSTVGNSPPEDQRMEVLGPGRALEGTEGHKRGGLTRISLGDGRFCEIDSNRTRNFSNCYDRSSPPPLSKGI